jgi:hypothetical protein
MDDTHHITMHKNCGKPSLSRFTRLCKRIRGPHAAPRAAALALLLLAATAGCNRPGRTITLSTLENAPAAVPVRNEQRIVTNPAALQSLCVSLAPRLALLQVRNAADWRRLNAAVPNLGPTPDFRTGMVVGLVSHSGTPLGDDWPVRVGLVHIADGAGLIEGEVHGGTYLPDGTAYAEIAHVPGLRAVLAVELNGTTFIPH